MTSKYSKFVRVLLIAILMLAMLAISLRHLSASISLQESQLDYLPETQINWSRFAYTQYATDRSYLCNSVMIFEALHRLGSKADLVLMYPSNFLVSENDDSPEAHLLRFARDKYAVKLKPMEVIYKGGGGGKSLDVTAAIRRTKSGRRNVVKELHEASHFQSNRIRQSPSLRL